MTTGYNENGISGIAGSFLSKSAVVKNCYHAGAFSSTNSYPRYGIGRQTTAINSYYLNGGGAGTAITEAKMRSWAFPFCLNSQSMDGAWAYIPGQYPGFGTLARPESWETVGQGVMDGLVTGVTFTPESGVYKIGSAEQLAVFAATVNRGSTAINATLTMDISLVGERYGGSIASPIPWYPIGDENKTYKGTFDGAGKAIGYMRVEKDGFAGLFGCAGGGAVISGVGIDSSCKVTSTGDASGNGTAALLGAVKSDETAVTQITIQNCYSRAEVNGAGSAAFTAGFIGTYLGSAGGSESISNCYNAGKITAVDGTAGSAIAGTFLHGSGGGIKNCYWDSQTSGGVTAVVTGGGATVENCGGKTTAVMKSDGAGGILDLLNENLGAGTWYRVDTRNDGYPIFMKSESEIDWGDVGAAMMAPRSKHASSSPGTASDPYLIWTPENLAWFSYQVNQVSGNSGLCAELMTDLDLFGGTYSGHAYDTSNPGILSKALLWIPIGDGAVPYTGTFLGNDHTVRVMRAGAAAAENQGLFGTVGDGARISGLAVTESQVSAARYSGGIAGRIDGTGVVVNNCQIAGKLTGDGDYFGGIAGMISGSGVTVTGCRNTGEITGTGNYIGGIAGAAQSSGSIVIDGCYSSTAGKIETTGASKTHIGGILGGGLAGSGTVTVRNCYHRGMVSAGSSGSQAGGIAGSAVQSTEIAGCYNAGQVTGNSAYQSIAGANAGTGNISSCFYQNDCPADVNAKALSRSVLQTWGAAFALNGEQLSQSTGISWDYHADKNDGYPWPAAETPGGAADWEDVGEAAFNGLLDGAVPALSGTTCQIATAEQLAWFAYRVNHEDYTTSADLTADINMDVAGSRYVSGRRLSWKPIGAITARAYDGVFQSAPDSRKIYQIQNLYVNDAAQAAGLFGIIGNGRVSRIGIFNADVTGKVAGGIAGYLQGGEVSQCYNRGGSRVTSSSDEAGGVVGRLVTSTGCIKDCYNINTVIKGGSTAGGIAGRTDGAVKNCFNANLTGGSIAGADGTYAISSGSSTNMKQCYSDTSLGDSAYVGQLDCSDDTKLQTQTDLLNTVDGSERKGTDRVWFTSLAEEETKGLPTLDAPEMYQIILSPASADTGTTGSLENGISIPDAKLRRIHLEKDSTSTDAVNLTEAVTVAGNFHNYGTDNANANLGLKAGATDVSVLPQSLTTPTASLSSFSQMTLYTAAAYTHASERKLLLEASSGTTRYEISITIPGVTSKPLKVSLPVSVNMELDPNVGTQPISYSADLELKNLNDYPIKAFITSVEKLPGKDVILTPIAKSAVIDQFKPLAAAGIKLGITSPASGTDTGNIAGQPDGKIYYTPSLAGSAEKWMAGELGYEKTLRYRYFIEHSRIQAAAGQSFGFKIIYKFEIPTGDNTGVVAVAPAS